MLAMDDNGAPLWSIVDPLWYRAFYPIVESLLGPDDTPEEIYRQFGQKLGHSPNPYFHELWYLAQNQDVQKTAANGDIESGFSHYCQHGHQERAPHWLFNPDYYAKQFADRYGRALQPETDGDPYTHFLRSGQHEGISGHWLFDPAAYEALSPYNVVCAMQVDGPFSVFMSRLGLEQPEHAASNFFNPAWYLQRYPEVEAGIASGAWTSGLEHYLTNGMPAVYDPSPLFSEHAYITAYEDVRAAIASNKIRNGYEHYRLHGWREKRPFFSGV